MTVGKERALLHGSLWAMKQLVK